MVRACAPCRPSLTSCGPISSSSIRSGSTACVWAPPSAAKCISGSPISLIVHFKEDWHAHESPFHNQDNESKRHDEYSEDNRRGLAGDRYDRMRAKRYDPHLAIRHDIA